MLNSTVTSYITAILTAAPTSDQIGNMGSFRHMGMESLRAIDYVAKLGCDFGAKPSDECNEGEKELHYMREGAQVIREYGQAISKVDRESAKLLLDIVSLVETRASTGNEGISPEEAREQVLASIDDYFSSYTSQAHAILAIAQASDAVVILPDVTQAKIDLTRISPETLFSIVFYDSPQSALLAKHLSPNGLREAIEALTVGFEKYLHTDSTQLKSLMNS